MSLKYAGEALFLIGLAYRLLRWALSAVAEGDAPPSAYAAMPAAAAPQRGLFAAARVADTFATASSSADAATVWYRTGLAGVPPAPGDPALFPPEMLAAMPPEQQVRIVESLAKQRRAAS